MLRSIFIYLACINLFTAIAFWRDKRKAIKEKPRTPEARLHLLELLGGVFAVFLLMYRIRHKNRKFSYYIWTYLILVGWLFLITVLFHQY